MVCSLSYGERQLLKIEQLQIYNTDRIGLIGENGAGKTTLMQYPLSFLLQTLAQLIIYRLFGGISALRAGLALKLQRVRFPESSQSMIRGL